MKKQLFFLLLTVGAFTKEPECEACCGPDSATPCPPRDLKILMPKRYPEPVLTLPPMDPCCRMLCPKMPPDLSPVDRICPDPACEEH